MPLRLVTSLVINALRDESTACLRALRNLALKPMIALIRHQGNGDKLKHEPRPPPKPPNEKPQ